MTALPRLQLRVVTRAKRYLDALVSASVLVALLPLFAAVAVAIKVTDFGPVFVWQERVGMHGVVLGAAPSNSV